MKLPAKYWLGIIAVLLLSMWLGARKLNADGVWYDEWWSLYIAGADVFNVPRAPADIWQRISTEDMWQAPLFAFTLAGWGSAVGWTEYATRALSLLAGMVALAGLFRLGWTLSKQPAIGLGAAALLGTSVWFIYFLHELRVYMLLVMLTVLMLLLYRRLMYGQREPRLWAYAVFALVVGLLANTHYFALLIIGVLGFWHLVTLVNGRPTRRWWGAMSAWFIAGVMLIPSLINIQMAAELTRDQNRATPDAALIVRMAGDTLVAFSNTNVALLVILLAFSLLARRTRWLWLLGLLLLPLNLAAYTFFKLDELRYNMTLLPLLALLASFGLYELVKRRVPALLIVGIWVTAGLIVEGDFQFERIIQRWPSQTIREMAAVLKTQVEPGDVIVNLIGNEDNPGLASHPMVHYMGSFGARIEVVDSVSRPGVQPFAAWVRETADDANRLWLLNDPRWQSDQWSLMEYLLNEQDLYHCSTPADREDMRIWGFARINDNAPAWRYGESIRLSSANTHIENGVLNLWLMYQVGEAVLPNTYSVGVYLMDAAGQVQGQYDMGLPTNGRSCHAAVIPVAALPAGDYTVHAAVYNWQTGERLMSTAPDGDESDLPDFEVISIN
ncbi:MAG: hypothetical protein LCI00_23840 [Chloroflexi bacterium]|nr:hypothetical protein [Chloroflexota bacterium]MCC6896089.1 glycosyltransferase family 39 protein [Anaerolineae bacterium]